MKNLLWLVVTGALLSGCAGSPSDADTTLDDDDAIRVEMYERLFELEPLLTASAYCLAHGTAEQPRAPSNAVLAVLANNVPRPVADGDCQQGRDGPEFNGSRAVAYFIQTFARTGNTAVVEGHARRTSLDSVRYRCNAAKVGTDWQITGCTKL
jgi:hypothetical protein